MLVSVDLQDREKVKSGDRRGKAEYRIQKSEFRSQESEYRSQKVIGDRWKDRIQNTEFRSKKNVRTFKRLDPSLRSGQAV